MSKQVVCLILTLIILEFKVLGSWFTFHGSRFTFHGPRFTVNDSQFTDQDSQFTGHRSRFAVHGSWLTVQRSPFTICRSRFRVQIHSSKFTVAVELPWDTLVAFGYNTKPPRDTVMILGYLGSWMTTCVGRSCWFGLPRVPFVNCCEFMYLIIFRFVLRAGCRIWLD